MAASKYDLQLSNGQTLSVWQLANQAVGSSPACTLEGAASATTLTTDFSVRNDCFIQEATVAAALTAGGIEVYNIDKAQRSGKGINNLENYLVANKPLTPPKIWFKAGVRYRLIQTVAGNA